MRICQHCHTANRADATFCNTCGALLGKLPPPPPPLVPPPSVSQYATRPTNATGRLSPQTILHNRYFILQNIGQGGMAAVYQAQDTKTRAVVAIKEMSQDGLSPDDLREALDSFRAEADMLAKLHHPNLPRVFESFSENTRHYLVMEYIDGQTLEQRQQANAGKALPERDVLGWARQISDVLGYLHTRRPPIIFRDLKPSNIMLTRGGQIKLIDFGIARVFSPNRARDTQVLGTPGFAPPEQYGKAQTDARADIYAFGCTLYQLLTGYDPALTPFNLPPMRSRNPQISAQIQGAIERATKLDRDARYPSVDAFARDLFAAPSIGSRGAPKTTMPHPAATIPNASTTTAARPAASAARVASATMAAIVVVHPHDVVFGKLKAGQRGVMAITVSGQNNTPVHGQITPCSPWLRVDRARFDGPATVIQVSAETSKIPQTGPQRSALQISCDSQQLFVPVEVEVVPAAVGAAAQTQTKASATVKPKKSIFARASRSAQSAQPVKKQPKPPHPSRKYGLPAVAQNRLARFATALALSFGLSLWFLTTALHLVASYSQHVVLTAPVALGLFILASGVAIVGALAGSGGKRWVGRRLTTTLGALAGLVALLSVEGQWLVSRGFDSLTHAVTVPGVILWLAPLLIGLGAALGSEQRYSRWVLRVLWFIGHRAPIVTTLLVIAAGAWLGFVLTQGHAFIIPCGVIAGIIAGLACAGPTNQILRRMVPIRP